MLKDYIEGHDVCVLEYVEQCMATHPGPVYLGHGCNCLTKMGAGFAKYLTALYPEAHHADIAYSRCVPPSARLGTFSSVEVVSPNDNHFIIVNFYTQMQIYPRDKKHFRPDMFEKALNLFHKRFGSDGVLVIPPIGCGNAGGDLDEDLMPVVERSPVKIVVINRT